MSKSKVVFGASAQQVKQWSSTTTSSFGLSQRQAISTASSFGALFRPIGLTGTEAAKQSEKLTQLGADLASFYNTTSSPCSTRSGQDRRQSEPLRQYGVPLSETSAAGSAEGIGKEHVSELTNQEKARADQHHHARLQDGRRLVRTRWRPRTKREPVRNLDNLAASIGKTLIPARQPREENKRTVRTVVETGQPRTTSSSRFSSPAEARPPPATPTTPERWLYNTRRRRETRPGRAGVRQQNACRRDHSRRHQRRRLTTALDARAGAIANKKPLRISAPPAAS
jgi:hypothetical protein